MLTLYKYYYNVHLHKCWICSIWGWKDNATSQSWLNIKQCIIKGCFKITCYTLQTCILVTNQGHTYMVHPVDLPECRFELKCVLVFGSNMVIYFYTPCVVSVIVYLYSSTCNLFYPWFRCIDKKYCKEILFNFLGVDLFSTKEYF